MTNIGVFVIITVAAFWYATPLNAASVPTQKFVEDQHGLEPQSDFKHLRIQRAADFMFDDRHTTETCPAYRACGYTIYCPRTRRIIGWMSDVCVCPDETYRCVRTRDSLSTNTYVHHCRQNTSRQDIGPPEFSDR